MKKVILSGMRPTGKLHIGHLQGALNNWVKLQDEYECFFMVADWHAYLSEYENPDAIAEFAIDNVIDWLSCGIDPEKSTIFVQSHVQYHAELALILGTITPLSWLERCPTYKEQLKEIKGRDITTFGFLGYPVLQAADILLYNADCVPVGMDQLPHLELTREIARRFNSLYKQIFIEPQPLLTQTPKILGLDSRKMSKSYNNFIALSDTDKDIIAKVKTMFTDPKRIKRTDCGHPDKCNVCSYYKIFAPEMAAQVHDECVGAKIGCTDDKARLADIIIKKLAPIQKKREALSRDKDKIMMILNQGGKIAAIRAEETMAEIHKAIKI